MDKRRNCTVRSDDLVTGVRRRLKGKMRADLVAALTKYNA